MGVKSDLRQQFGREPTDTEVLVEKTRRKQASQKPHKLVIMTMQQVVGKRKTSGMHYRAVNGPLSTNEMVVRHNGATVVTTLGQVREWAAASFAINSGHGLQVFMGPSVETLRFVANNEAWQTRFEIMHAAGMPETSIFVCEVVSKERESTLANVRPTAVAADLHMQASLVELDAAARMAAKLGAQKPVGAGKRKNSPSTSPHKRHQSPSPQQKQKKSKAKARAKEVSIAAEDSDGSGLEGADVKPDDDELAQTFLSHMQSQLEMVLTAHQKKANTEGKPPFVLTTGETDPEGSLSFVKFDPANLTLSHIDVRNGGTLRPDTLFLGCTEDFCAAKFCVKAPSNARGSGGDGLSRLKSAAAIVGKHEHTSDAAKERDAKAAKCIKTKTPSPATPNVKSAKAAEVSSIKNSLLKATALAQSATPSQPCSIAAEPTSTGSRSKGLTEAESPAPDVVMLRLPFDPKLQMHVELKKDQLEQASMRGAVVSEVVFDVLREIEHREFGKRAKELLQRTACPIGDEAAKRVLILPTHAYLKLEIVCRKHRGQTQSQLTEKLTEKGGVYDRMLAKHIKISDAMESYDVVSFGVTGGCHFSEVIWLPLIDEVYALDSYPPCGHYEKAKKVATT